MNSKFIHLHTHSHYSLLEALPKIEDLVAAAKADGHEAIALTDLGNMYGAIDFYRECKKEGLKPIIGVEFFIAPRTRFDKEFKTDDPTARVILLAKNEAGYKNLLQLVTKSHLEGFFIRPRIDRELIEQYKTDLIALLPPYYGEHAQAIATKNLEQAEQILEWYKKLFEDDLYAEITLHSEIEGHDARVKKIVELARKLHIPLCAAHDTFYLKPEDGFARELVNKIRTGGTLNRDIEEGIHDLSFQTRKQMAEKFKHIPEALDTPATIAEKCDLELHLGKWFFPDFPIPKGTTHDQLLRELTYSGFERRDLKKTPEIVERVDYELSVISKKGYSPYFLVVSDLLRHAREVGIFTNTRGSAAGSLVSYLSGITTVNPLVYQLPFERFLNPERPSPPDIDMDLADNKRDQLIEYVRHKYGDDHVAQIGTFGTMMARAAVRDVSRALGYSYGVGDQIAKLIPFGKQGFPVTIESAMIDVPELKVAFQKDSSAHEILELAQKIEGNARHVGVHAAGVVISPTPVTDFVPIQLDPKGGKTITQYDMYAVEDAGLLKFDFLGLTNLSVLADAVARVRERLGVEIDIDKLPQTDEKTFKMLSRGETLGVFQMASSGMTNYLMQLKPTRIDDLNVMVALYRPGPMNNIDEYIARKNGKARITYLNPKMESYLAKTFGVLVYQDDLLMTAIEIAGYSWGEVDKFRKAVGKKIPEEMAKQHVIFVEGCVKHSGMKKQQAEALWALFEPFQGYGFNKAHAASYGNLAYQTAYMKANFPVDYMAAVLTADSGDVEKISEIVGECVRMGIKVLPPSVQSSLGDFTVVDEKSIRFGLHSIKNFGTGVGDSIIASREADGPFKDGADFLCRIGDKNLNKKSLEALIKCGAFDEFGERGQLLANIDTLLAYHRQHMSAPRDQSSLFGTLSKNNGVLRLSAAPAAQLDEKLAWEKELLGLYVSGHPLERHRAKFNDPKKSIKHAKEHLKGVATVIGGFVESARVSLTKNGERMAFIKVVDFTDGVEVVVFPRTFKEIEKVITPGACVAIAGRISERGGDISFMAEKAKNL